MNKTGIEVRSHVARDLLQSAELFKSDKLVVWEYVSNSLQYTDPGITPIVRVTINDSRKRIMVEDNGRGMDRDGLSNYFIMHGENLDRKAGNRGRGRFGTGKSAAFGIANKLRVSSVREGKKNTVELTRDDIEAAGDDRIPVHVIEKDTMTEEPNGTVVTVSEIKLRKLDSRNIITFLERHLARWPSRPTVIINNHECEFVEPPVQDIRVIRPDDRFKDTLGDVELTLKVAKTPLDADFQGVSVCANGVWLESTLSGAENQPMANFIFGEIDVPKLDDESGPIPAFDMSRSMRLNPNNETVQSLYQFIGPEIDKLRRELVKKEKSRRDQQEAKKLAREAELIAQMINEDFEEYSDRVARVKAKAGQGRDAGKSTKNGDSKDDILSNGDSFPAERLRGTKDIGGGSGNNGKGTTPPDNGPILQPTSESEDKGDPAGGNGHRKRSRGGFSVDFREMGQRSPRATYSTTERLILVNLEHPQINAALGTTGSEDPVFKRLAYEVAFSEYAVALAQELVPQGEFIDLTDPIVHIRETLNRMARRAASLYRA